MEIRKNISAINQFTGKCVFPYKYKRQTYNDCIPIKDKDGNHRVCATKVNPKTLTRETFGFCLPEGMTPEQYDAELVQKIKQSGGGCSKQDIMGVNYKIDKKGNKKISRSKKVVPGKCIFPFKHKRVTHNECADSEDKTFKYCAMYNPEGTMKISMLSSPIPKSPFKPIYKVVKKNHLKVKTIKRRKMILNPVPIYAFGQGFKINDSTKSDGDCFFDSLTVALDHHGYTTDIRELREIVLEECIDRENFELYKELYQNALIGEDYEMANKKTTSLRALTPLKTLFYLYFNK